MHPSRINYIAPFVLTWLLQACAATPSAPPAGGGDPAADPTTAQTPASAPEEVPQLTLHLEPTEACDCGAATTPDYTFYDKGYSALLDGEYEDAMEHFQRYQRLETSPRADLEAGIAIAYIRMLPRSSFYDPQAARTAFRELREKNAKKLVVHDSTRLMRQAVLNLLELQDKIDSLKAGNDRLKEDLAKREEALKRLRELTLSQKPAAQ